MYTQQQYWPNEALAVSPAAAHGGMWGGMLSSSDATTLLIVDNSAMHKVASSAPLGLEFCTTHVCPSPSVSFDNSGVPSDVYGSCAWYPLIMANCIFLGFFLFYLITSVGSRWAVRHVWCSTDASGRPLKGAEAMEVSQKQYVYGGYLASCIHAAVSVLTGLIAIGNANGWIECVHFSFYFVAMHSMGYFAADMLVDRSPTFMLHHIAPMIYVEIMLRCGGSLYHAVIFGVICEIGNLISHTCRLSKPHAGPHFRSIFVVSHVCTRPLSLIPLFYIVWCDVPVEYRAYLGVPILLLALCIYASNIMAWKGFELTLGGTSGAVATLSSPAGSASIGYLTGSIARFRVGRGGANTAAPADAAANHMALVPAKIVATTKGLKTASAAPALAPAPMPVARKSGVSVSGGAVAAGFARFASFSFPARQQQQQQLKPKPIPAPVPEKSDNKLLDPCQRGLCGPSNMKKLSTTLTASGAVAHPWGSRKMDAAAVAAATKCA